MTDFLTMLRARQAEINTEIASHMAAVSALVAELGDIAASARVFATLAATESTAVRTDAPNQKADGHGAVNAAGAGTQAPPVDTNSAANPAADDEGTIPALKAEVAPPAASVDLSRAKPVVEAVAGSAMSEGSAVAESPETAETGSRLDAGRTASATSETMDATAGETAAVSGGAPNEASPAPRAVPGARLIDRLTALYAEHPDWTAGQFAKAMPDANHNSVSTTLTQVRKAARAEPVQARSPAPAPEPAPQPERPPTQARAPIATVPSGSGSAVISKPMARAPRGTRFNLRNDAGLYLHNSCEAMTDNRKWAWEGSADQLLACRKRFPMATDLAEFVVEKEQARAVA